MRNTSTRLVTTLSFFGLLASSAFAGGIKHPSDYGDLSFPINFPPCSTPSTTVDGVVASCFQGTGPSPDDFVFTFALVTPSASTSITSVTFNLTDVPGDFGLVEGDATDCADMNVVCTPPQVTINDGSPLATGPNKFTFTNFTGDLMVTEYFAYDDSATAPTFTGAITSATTATPEPSEIGILIAAFGCVIAARRTQLAKRNS